MTPNPPGTQRLEDAPQDPIGSMIQQLEVIRSDMLTLESQAEPLLKHLAAHRQASGRNLLHYIALRRHDIRELQEQLVLQGLSSLGRCESFVMANLETVLRILCQVAGSRVPPAKPEQIPVHFATGRSLLKRNTQDLLGEADEHSAPSIMVTMPSEAAENSLLVRDLLASGMDVMRINCAHDDPEAWAAMIHHLRQAQEELERPCRVAMDLAGPKIRTGPIEPGPEVIRWQPYRDAYGRVIAPARIWISPHVEGPHPAHTDLLLPVSSDWWQRIETGDQLQFVDAAGRNRRLNILQTQAQGVLAESTQTAYITRDTVVMRIPSADQTPEPLGNFGPIPAQENYLVLREGDLLQVTDAQTLGRPAQFNEQGHLLHHASIGCTLPQIFRDVRRGDRILFDDGKIAGVIEDHTDSELLVKIKRAKLQGSKLRADKGINFPDTDLKLPALTEKDLQDLKFIAEHADLVCYSFVRRAEDIQQLLEALQQFGHSDLGIVLKIENQQAFNNLPRLLLEVMRCNSAGVMIARGDLGVECGWERLAEMQEEILWMCEAAHLPVIWATQVLEGLAKKGLPTRAEVTDAAMGARAECVMLNKGPHIVETVHLLNDILRRMQQHQVKKRATFRRLRMADRLF